MEHPARPPEPVAADPLPTRISEWIEDLGSHTFYQDVIYHELRPYGIQYEDGTLWRRGISHVVKRYTPAQMIVAVRAQGNMPKLLAHLDDGAFLIVGYDIARDLFLMLRATTWPDDVLAEAPGDTKGNLLDAWRINIAAIREMGL
jgi:hypothetical protein